MSFAFWNSLKCSKYIKCVFRVIYTLGNWNIWHASTVLNYNLLHIDVCYKMKEMFNWFSAQCRERYLNISTERNHGEKLKKLSLGICTEKRWKITLITMPDESKSPLLEVTVFNLEQLSS